MESKIKSSKKESTTKLEGSLKDHASLLAAVEAARGTVYTDLQALAAALGAAGMGNTTEGTHVRKDIVFYGREYGQKQGTV